MVTSSPSEQARRFGEDAVRRLGVHPAVAVSIGAGWAGRTFLRMDNVIREFGLPRCARCRVGLAGAAPIDRAYAYRCAW